MNIIRTHIPSTPHSPESRIFSTPRRHRALAACAALSLALLGGCSGSSDSANTSGKSGDDQLAVSASFYPIAWLAEQIGADAVTVTSVTPANVEPHEFELSPKDVSTLSQADLIAYVEGFQPSLDDAVANISGPTVVNLVSSVNLQKADAATAEHEAEHHHHADSADTSEDSDSHGDHEAEEHHDHDDHADHEHTHEEADHAEGDTDADEHGEDTHEEDEHGEDEHHHGELGLDPHFWLDPDRMKDAGEALEEAFAQADPDHQEAFEKNWEALEAKLTTLDESFTQGLKQCSLRTIVTSHAAFGYLTSRYDLTQESISGIDPESEPSPAELAAVKEVVHDSGTTTIFTEELLSPKTAEALAEETGASTAVLSPLESKPESGDYISAMEENLKELRTALQCK